MISQKAARVAGFEIIEMAPSGGTAVVYKARHTPTGNLCALKLLAPNIAPQRLRREADLLSRLNHPAIVRPLEHGTIESIPYLATRWIEGTRLADYLSSEAPLTQTHAIRFIRQLIDALQHAHERGVVHGDLSAANIILDSESNLTVVDFGTGRDETSATVTVSTDLAGTLRYIAPEVIHGSKASPLSDQYSLALVFYEMLTGRWPYPGEVTPASALHHHLSSEPVPVNECNPSISSHICAVLDQALAKEPEKRFSNLRAMEQAVRSKPGDTIITSAKRDRLPARMKGHHQTQKLALIAGSCVVAAVIFVSSAMWDADESAPASALVSETFASESETDLRCNLLKTPALNEDGVVENFYQDNELKDRISLREDGNPWQLEIGKSNHYGLYGQIIAVQPLKQYQLAAVISRQGYLDHPSLRIEWLDADYQVQPDLLVEFTFRNSENGKVSTPLITTPDNVSYAVPTIYKDASVGTLVAHSIVFKSADCT